jgi:hypothetical protein
MILHKENLKEDAWGMREVLGHYQHMKTVVMYTILLPVMATKKRKVIHFVW